MRSNSCWSRGKKVEQALPVGIRLEVFKNRAKLEISAKSNVLLPSARFPNVLVGKIGKGAGPIKGIGATRLRIPQRSTFYLVFWTWATQQHDHLPRTSHTKKGALAEIRAQTCAPKQLVIFLRLDDSCDVASRSSSLGTHIIQPNTMPSARDQRATLPRGTFSPTLPQSGLDQGTTRWHLTFVRAGACSNFFPRAESVDPNREKVINFMLQKKTTRRRRSLRYIFYRRQRENDRM